MRLALFFLVEILIAFGGGLQKKTACKLIFTSTCFHAFPMEFLTIFRVVFLSFLQNLILKK